MDAKRRLRTARRRRMHENSSVEESVAQLFILPLTALTRETVTLRSPACSAAFSQTDWAWSRGRPERMTIGKDKWGEIILLNSFRES